MKARPHLPAYQFLVVQRPSKVLSDQLEALVALGLYFESECKYFASFTAEPTPRELEAFHRVVSAPSALGKLREEATRLVDRFGDEVVAKAQRDHLTQAVAAAVEAVHGAPRSFWRGVWEAITAAALYSVMLIIFSIIAHRLGIDILEAYRHAYGPG
jgi:hypothetical protein